MLWVWMVLGNAPTAYFFYFCNNRVLNTCCCCCCSCMGVFVCLFIFGLFPWIGIISICLFLWYLRHFHSSWARVIRVQTQDCNDPVYHAFSICTADWEKLLWLRSSYRSWQSNIWAGPRIPWSQKKEFLRNLPWSD